MIEFGKRLIEAERRLARLESTLHRTNRNVTAVRSAVRNDGQNVKPPFGSGGTPGGTGVHRFPVSYFMRVEWDTLPTVRTTSNLAADSAALTTAITKMEDGFTLDTNYDIERFLNHLYDSTSGQPALYSRYGFQGTTTISGYSVNWNAYFQFAYFDDDTFLADPSNPSYSGDLFQGSIPPETSAGLVTRLQVTYPRFSGGGGLLGYTSITARRTLASEDNFASGPSYGSSDSWSFAMECPSGTYNNAGSGTIYLEW